jgi:acyl-CoA synthetase (AMP-forming)/AMP-acid ligase II
MDPATLGYLAPDAQLQTVDDAHHVLPAGQEGRIRVRTPFMVQAYLDDPEATAASFHDGWFYTGDIGCILDNGLVLHRGRSSDVLNLGGIKFDAAEIDHFLRELPGVHDAAAFETEDDSGRPAVALAIVADDSADLAHLLSLAQERFARTLHRSFVIRATTIPRGHTGKILRHQLTQTRRTDRTATQS